MPAGWALGLHGFVAHRGCGTTGKAGNQHGSNDESENGFHGAPPLLGGGTIGSRLTVNLPISLINNHYLRSYLHITTKQDLINVSSSTFTVEIFHFGTIETGAFPIVP